MIANKLIESTNCSGSLKRLMKKMVQYDIQDRPNLDIKLVNRIRHCRDFWGYKYKPSANSGKVLFYFYNSTSSNIHTASSNDYGNRSGYYTIPQAHQTIFDYINHTTISPSSSSATIWSINHSEKQAWPDEQKQSDHQSPANDNTWDNGTINDVFPLISSPFDFDISDESFPEDINIPNAPSPFEAGPSNESSHVNTPSSFINNDSYTGQTQQILPSFNGIAYLENKATDERIPISSTPFTVGRSSENNYCIKDSAVSRQHFRIEHQNNQFRLYSEGTQNGIVINGIEEKEVSGYPLENNTTIKAGHTELLFKLKSNSFDDI